ncbi:dynein heavy chain 17, axonemal-like [Echeneis naucrates]|uniref:dynein heavy chain 17, axonemal-like n=1 Tax=Echeneis naucrates TaxID=173247 RepID=UPI00111429E6|nr:dynein heavy chain 17, axonemal-like [Echeneis naucrates]
MAVKDQLLDPVRGFTINSLRVSEERWGKFVQENQVLFNSFCKSADHQHLFICQDPDSGLSVNLDFPQTSQGKVICVSKTRPEALTKENSRNILIFQEARGKNVLNFITCVTEQVTCPLLSNLEGMADKALSTMKRQQTEAALMKAQIQGWTFLPHPDCLHHDRHYDNAERGKVSDLKLLQACDWTIIEWAELVSDFLQQDSSQPVVDGLKPLPTEEFQFWKSRLKNLLFLQQQLMSSRAQQLAFIVQEAQSVYWSILRDICRDVQEGVKEAEDVTMNLAGLQEKLEEVEQMQYQQVGDNMAFVLEEVRLVWTRSEFYCRPCRMVVLLQEICNLFIHLSRKLLCGEEMMRGLVSKPGLILDDVRLVIRTLQAFKEAYNQTRTQLEGQKKSWDFASHLVFFHLDNFLQRLHALQDVFSVSVKLYKLDQVVLSGVNGSMWTDVVQDLYQDFLFHVTVLSDCDCDPTDPEDRSFELHLEQFQIQVSDLERRLVSVLTRVLDTCRTSASVAKLISTFRFFLDRPLFHNQLRPALVQLLDMVLNELDQTEVLFHRKKEGSDTYSKFSPGAAAELCWTQQLRLRAEESVRNYMMLQDWCVDSAHVVQQRFQQIVDILQDFRDKMRSDCSLQLDSDCGLILELPLIQINQQGMMAVSGSHKLEALLRELRYVSKETDVKLRPCMAKIFSCRDDIIQTYLMLSHMVSCYNQVVGEVVQVELPLIKDQLQDLNQSLSELQRSTWGSEVVQQLVEQQTLKVLRFHSTVSEARANMDTITHIIQEWADLQLLQRSGDSLLLERGATQNSYRRIEEEGQELLHLIQLNRNLYGALDSSESWVKYLDHIDDKVQDGLFQLLLRSLHFLSNNMDPQTCSGALLAVSLELQETGSVYEPPVKSLSDFLMTIISDVYTVATLPPRITIRCQSNYQVLLQQRPELSVLEKEVMQQVQHVKKEAELLRVELDRYSHLWQSDRQAVMQEFLTYSRQLGPEELEADETPPTLKDFQREIESLQRLSTEVTHLDDITVLHGWLQVDLQPFRDSLLSIIHGWKNMYTEHLLDAVRDSLQKVTEHDGDEESSSSSSYPLTETIILLGAAGVELPEHLSAQLQV